MSINTVVQQKFRIQLDVVIYHFNRLRSEGNRNCRDDGGNVTVEVIIQGTKTKFSGSITCSVRENSVQLDIDFSTS